MLNANICSQLFEAGVIALEVADVDVDVTINFHNWSLGTPERGKLSFECFRGGNPVLRIFWQSIGVGI